MRQAFRSFRPASKALTASATCTINKPSSISLVGKVGGIVPNSCHESLEPSGSFNFNRVPNGPRFNVSMVDYSGRPPTRLNDGSR
jgi:hypothetical protein